MEEEAADLEEEAEADPLVVLVVAALQGVLGLVHPGVGDIEPDPLPEGTRKGLLNIRSVEEEE